MDVIRILTVIGKLVGFITPRWPLVEPDKTNAKLSLSNSQSSDPKSEAEKKK